VIGRLPDVFDSHAFIVAAMKHHAQLYVRELHRLVTSADPIEATHGVIAHALGRTPIIEKHGIVSSINARGDKRQNQQWRKCRPLAKLPVEHDDPASSDTIEK